MKTERRDHSLTRASFTLLETVVAITIMALILMQVTGTQANAIYFSEYGRNAAQAISLGRRIMDQVEYRWRKHNFIELDTENAKGSFEDVEDFEYQLSIRKWDLPIMKMVTSGMGGGDDNESPPEDPQDPLQGGAGEDLLKSVIGDELLRVAHVEVSWPEGAVRNQIEITYLLTNQVHIDNLLNAIGSQ